MSTIIMSACWPLQGMSPAQKTVLISLADQANDDGVCWPSVGSIAKRTCLSSRAVQDAIAWLESACLVKREFRFNTSTSYTVTPNCYSPEKAAPARKRARKDAPESGAPGADGAPPADSAPPANGAGVQMAHPPQAAQEGGANGAGAVVQMAHPTPANGAPRTVIEPSVEPSGEPPTLPVELAAPALPGNGGLIVDPAPRCAIPSDMPGPKDQSCKTFRTWANYAIAYRSRYKAWPLWNKSVGGKLDKFINRVGQADAPKVAAFYVKSVEDPQVTKRNHPVGLLLSNAEGYHTQWLTNRPTTNAQARQQERTATNLTAMEQALAEQRARRQANADA